MWFYSDTVFMMVWPKVTESSSKLEHNKRNGKYRLKRNIQLF